MRDQKNLNDRNGSHSSRSHTTVTERHIKNLSVESTQAVREKHLALLNNIICKKVVGQDHAINSINKAMLRRRGELSKQNWPIGFFLFLGTHGVGKTELAKALALELFHSTKSVIRIDMSKYREFDSIARLLGVSPIKNDFSIARLIGASSKHVGFEQDGELAEAIRRQPCAVIIFDKVEKAHPEMWNRLLEVLDNSRLADGKGRTVDFTNTILVLTSNIGAEYILDEVKNQSLSIKISNGKLSEIIKNRIMREVRLYFRLEFLNRLDDIIFFQLLNINQMSSIIHRQLKSLEECLKEQDIRINLTNKAIQSTSKKCYNPVYGAGPLKHYLETRMTTKLSKLLMQPSIRPHSLVTIDTDINDKYLFHIQPSQRTTSNSSKKPAYVRHRTHEISNEKPMIDVDGSTSPRHLSKRRKQSP